MRLTACLQAAACAATLLSTIAEAQTAPLPPPRPDLEGAKSAPPTSPEPPAAPAAPEQKPPQPIAQPDRGPETCVDRLRKAGFEVERAAQPGNGACVIDTPVRLKSVTALSGARVRITAEPVLACQFADAFGRFVGALAAPLLQSAKGAEIKSVSTGPGFECRNRNRAATGKISAHAAGLAIDISSFDFANGSSLRVARDHRDPLFASVRTAACGWFTTILGPGSDASHSDHLHVDIMRHGSTDRYRICQ